MEADINLILELIIVLLGLIAAVLGKKWHSAIKLTEKIPLIGKVFEEGADVFKKLGEIEDFSKLKKDDLMDLLREAQEFVAALKKAYEEPVVDSEPHGER